MIDTASGKSERLADSLDYRYVSTIMPPVKDQSRGYLFVPEACIKRLVGPAAKISEKRRLQCSNNLVMLNNASMFYRLEHRKSPSSLSENKKMGNLPFPKLDTTSRSNGIVSG